MGTSKKPRQSQPPLDVDEDQSRMRIKSRDPDLRALEAAQQAWRDGTIDEHEYIDRAVALFMREVSPWMTDEQRQDMASVLRFTCNTSPEMRTRLGLDPFGDDS